MKKIVCKFGGSNFRNPASIDRIAQVIEQYNRPLVVVVSAFYGITNELLHGMDQVQQDEGHIKKLMDSITLRKIEAIEETITEGEQKKNTRKILDQRLKELERYLLGIHYIGELPRIVKDQILSYGERLSSLILTGTLKSRGIDAVEALPEDIGLYTDGGFQDATVDFTQSREPINKALSGERIYIVPGFYGMSPQGKVTLLGRGGSDYSAASIAYSIDAESLDVWKDVDGYMSGDPKMVPEARRITHLTYSEAAELSYFGAQILHPRTVEPLMDVAIPIRIFNIEEDNPDLTPLTEICQIYLEENQRNEPVRSVTYSDDFAILRLSGPGVGMKQGILGKVTGALGHRGINIQSVVTSQTAINLYLNLSDRKEAIDLLLELDLPAVHRIESLEELSVIALVGHGLNSHSRTLIRIAETLGTLGITPEILSLGAAEGTAYFMVPREERTRVVRAIHQRFFGESHEV